MAEQSSNVVLNFQTNGQVQYAQTLKQLNMVMSTASKEYQSQITAMGKNADMTEKLRAEQQKLSTQMAASSEKVRMLNEEYEAMQNSTDATAEELQALYNKVLAAETAHAKLEQSMERVNAGLTDEAIAAREAKKEFNNLSGDARTLEAEQRRLASSFALQTAALGYSATEAERAGLAQRQFAEQMQLSERAIANLEGQLDAASRAYGENSREAIQLETRLNEARLTVQRLNDEFHAVAPTTERATSALDALRDTGSQLEAEQRRLTSQLELQRAQLGSNATEAERYELAQRQLDQQFNLSVRSVRNLEAQLEAARQEFGDNSREVMDLEVRLNNARTSVQRFSNELEDLESGAESAGQGLDKLSRGLQAIAGAAPAAAIAGLTSATQESSQQLAMLEMQVRNAGTTIKTFSNTTKKMSDEELANYEKNIEGQESKLEESLNNRYSALSKSYKNKQEALSEALDDEYDAVSKSYKKQEDVLQKSLNKKYEAVAKSIEKEKEEFEKSLSKQSDVFEKTLEKQSDELEKSLDAEVTAFEKATEAKIALIDKEYTEKLKLVDEEKYNRIKAIEAQIDGINAAQEAEDKRIKETENNRKRADLQEKIRTAKDAKAKQEATQALRDFEEKLRLDKAKEARREQIELLKIEKETVKETFDEKKDAIKSELDEKKQQVKDAAIIEKEAIQERQKAEKEALKENQKLEKDLFVESQNVQKEAFTEKSKMTLDALAEANKNELDSMKELNQTKLENLKDNHKNQQKMLDEQLSTNLEAVKKAHSEELKSFREMNEEKLELAKNPPEAKMEIVGAKISAELDLDDIKEARVSFAAVGQDINQTTEAMGNLIQAGYTTSDSINDISESLSGAIIKYGETFTAEGLAESINTTAQLGEVTGQLTDLLEKEGVNVEDFNEKLEGMATAEERANAISQLLADQGLAGMYKEYAKLNPEIVSAAEAQLEQEEALTKLGDVLRPLVTEVVKFTTSLIEWANENPVIAKTVAVVGTAVGALVTAFALLGPALGALPTIIPMVTKAFGGLSMAFGTIGRLLPLLGRAFAVLTGPIGLIVTALTIAVPLIIKNWEPISEFFSNLWDGIKEIFTSTVGAISDFLSGAWEGIKTGISDAWNGIKDFFKEWGPTILAVLTGPIGLIVKFFVDNWEQIKKFTTEAFSNTVKKVGEIWGGIKETISKPINLARDAVDKAINAIKGFFSNLKIKFPKLNTDIFETARKAVKTMIDAIKKLFNFEFKWPKLKMPKFEIKGTMNPLKWFDEGVPKIDVKWNAKGGIFTQPTIFGMSGGKLQGAGEVPGENEAVLPLNAQTLGDIGKGIAATMNLNGGSPIIVEKMEVRNDNDIKRIAREFYILQKQGNRGRANK